MSRMGQRAGMSLLEIYRPFPVRGGALTRVLVNVCLRRLAMALPTAAPRRMAGVTRIAAKAAVEIDSEIETSLGRVAISTGASTAA